MTQRTIPPQSFVLASRGSPLALWQANFVADLLRAQGHTIEVKTWKTTGDIVQDRFLHEIGGKGLFIKELEEAMISGQAHLAVHSLKDLPARVPAQFELAAVLKRHQSSDVIIFSDSFGPRCGLAPGSLVTADVLRSLGPFTVATSSLRRRSLLAGSCPEITTVAVRGNVNTRLKKLNTEGWQALILAEASLERLELNHPHSHRLDPNWFIPCAGQGALAIETLANSTVSNAVKPLECAATRQAVNIERAVLARLGGDCTMPFGCVVTEDQRDKDKLVAAAIILDSNGNFSKCVKEIFASSANIESTLEQLIIDGLRENKANDILKSLGLDDRI
jgi:hydroxymethylbilane synthase